MRQHAHLKDRTQEGNFQSMEVMNIPETKTYEFTNEEKVHVI